MEPITEKKLEIIEKISALADGVTLKYVNELSQIVNNPEADDKEKRKAFAEMDKVLRIAKLYSDRVLLAEGKTTANIGVEGRGGLPFKFVINKHYPKDSEQSPADSSQETDESDEETADDADEADS